MFDTRGDKGKKKITTAISTFDTITQDLQEGIDHCNAEVDRHNNIIKESEIEIEALENVMEKAARIHGKIKQIIE